MSESPARARVLSSRSVHAGRVVQLRVEEIELPSGRRSTLELVHHPGATAKRTVVRSLVLVGGHAGYHLRFRAIILL